ncbi:MAG TPA: hypothetical protein DDX19_01105 [Rhodopirellula baltica]|uniref:Uncharacterized protein n=2 Tax=Rhodopirellula baltica TaxID=265606 RepID=F2B258_RHOBT|nr:hypothetical protein RBWH47_01876 [Rhodopirellula baltica WH47]EKK04153.1 hypothetical protein RBSH_00575 [Rhodopirellula baltica SH28]HBE61375.1 hypothetical protein [Rhodopirellula baltica]
MLKPVSKFACLQLFSIFSSETLKFWRMADSIGVAVVREDVRPSRDGHKVVSSLPRMVMGSSGTLCAD